MGLLLGYWMFWGHKVTSGCHQSPWPKLICIFGGTTCFFPKVVVVMGGMGWRKKNSKCRSGWGEQPELLLGSRAHHCLVLAKCWAQKSSKEVLSLCLTVKDTHSSLNICVPKVKHVLNEARVLCLGQSWILNSSVFCSFCWKMELILPCFLHYLEDRLTNIHDSWTDGKESNE